MTYRKLGLGLLALTSGLMLLVPNAQAALGFLIDGASVPANLDATIGGMYSLYELR